MGTPSVTPLRHERPWGEFRILDEGHGYKVKLLSVNPRSALSLQRHRHRSEIWTVVTGIAEVTQGDFEFSLKPGDVAVIDAGVVHRLTNNSRVNRLDVIEVQTGNYLGEDDIERISDRYGRHRADVP